MNELKDHTCPTCTYKNNRGGCSYSSDGLVIDRPLLPGEIKSIKEFGCYRYIPK